jgi:hypothetical protein
LSQGEWAWNERLWGQEHFWFARSHLALKVEGQTIIVKWRNRWWGDEQDGRMWKNCIAVADECFNAVISLCPEQRPALLKFMSYHYGGHLSIFSALYWQNGTVCQTLAQPIICMRRYNVCVQCKTWPLVCSTPVTQSLRQAATVLARLSRWWRAWLSPDSKISGLIFTIRALSCWLSMSNKPRQCRWTQQVRLMRLTLWHPTLPSPH